MGNLQDIRALLGGPEYGQREIVIVLGQKKIQN